MKYESLPSLTLPKIGLGAARLGGKLIPNRSKDAFHLSALHSALELGYTHFDTAEFYAFGHSEELIGHALRETNTKRENVFITSKIWPTNLSHKNVLRACENSLRRLRTEYIDLYLIHWPNPFIPLKNTFRGLNQLVKEGKTRHIGVSNFNLKLLREAQSFSETPVLANQVPYSLFHRSYTQNGVLGYCQENNILITAYTPVHHTAIQVDKTIRTIADSYQATPYQIALAWLITQPRVITIPMSFNPQHQKENLDSANIELTQIEMEQLNKLA